MEKIDKVLSNIILYMNPEYLNNSKVLEIVSNYKGDKQLLEKYYKSIYAINRIFKKVMQYKLYFMAFYPTNTQISESECLEYHVHSYLQDLTILKNNIENLVNILYKDLSKKFNDKGTQSKINEKLKFLKEQLYEKFNEVLKHRNPHHHQGKKFFDANLSKLESINTMLNFHSQFGGLSDYGVSEFKKEKEVTFQTAQNERIQLAELNNISITKILNVILNSIELNLYNMLNITNITENILEKNKDT